MPHCARDTAPHPAGVAGHPPALRGGGREYAAVPRLQPNACNAAARSVNLSLATRTLPPPRSAGRGDHAERVVGGGATAMANETARNLRKTMTPQEVRLWQRLRALKCQGHHFRRQAPIETYIVDFACHGSRLVIELDGSQHAAPEHARRDERRDAALSAAGFRVLRVWNTDIDRNMDGVMQAIMTALRE